MPWKAGQSCTIHLKMKICACLIGAMRLAWEAEYLVASENAISTKFWFTFLSPTTVSSPSTGSIWCISEKLHALVANFFLASLKSDFA